MMIPRLAHYEINGHLGSGGMGDVYQATDTRLGRSVALKFLPEAFAHDAERAARFDREAKTLATLNHPCIAAIHGLEEVGGRSFLVMEFVPGQTLGERIGRRPVPLDEALSIARQVAEALESAHEKGIVHRDLKPANIKITPDGQVKVLDFGLAKLVAGEPGGSREAPGAQWTDSPTLTAPMTRPGMILGTPAYMAPEQAKGRPVDRRADVFAFGCLLYEMLTGRPAFDGDNVADTLSRVLQRDPDWTRVPQNVPASVRTLMRLCLEKDPRKRRQAAGDVRVDLEQALAEPRAGAPVVRDGPSRPVRLAWIAAAVVGMAALAIPAAMHLREALPAEWRLQIVTPPTRLPMHFALAPDGRSIVFVASESPSDTAQRLYLRALDETDAQPIAGTDGARSPFWSPDSRSLGFFASEQLHRIDIGGGGAQALAPAPAPQGGAWNEDGTILFAPNTVSPLLRVPASGGESVAATRLDSPRQLGHRQPSFLPGGRQFLFYAQGEPEVSGIYLGSLDGSAPKRLTAADGAGAYLPPDRVLFTQQGALVARRLDVARGDLTGDAVTVLPSAGEDASLGAFSTSSTGIVAYRAGSGSRALMTWFDRAGKVLGQAGDVNGPELSPDERRVAFDRTIRGNRDVWIMDLARGGLTRFTFDAAVDGYPVWSPDGSRIVFESTRSGTFDLWIKPSNGADAEQPLLETPDSEWPLHWSRDGRFLLYQVSDLKTVWDLWALPMTGGDRTPVAVANTPFAERMGEFSPDGRWIAYETNESGRPEIVAQEFPVSSGRRQISTGGGAAPRWRADGREVYFIAPDGKMMAVPVTTTGSTFEAGKPVALFSTQIALQAFKFQYAVSRDGRFLVNNVTAPEATASPITLILNWTP
jgi:Tol biopolymer transport system component